MISVAVHAICGCSVPGSCLLRCLNTIHALDSVWLGLCLLPGEPQPQLTRAWVCRQSREHNKTGTKQTVLQMTRVALHVSDLAPHAGPAEQPFVDVPAVRLTSDVAADQTPVLQLTVPSVAVSSAPAYISTISHAMQWCLGELEAMLGAGVALPQKR